MSQLLHIKYVECRDRYNVGHNGGHRKPSMGFRLVPWPLTWITLNYPSSRSSKLNVKYFKNGDKYDDGVNKSQIGNHPWAINWHHDLWVDFGWPWTVLYLGHKLRLTRQISRIWRQIQCWTQKKSDRKPSMGCRLALCTFILDDLELACFKVIQITRQILQKWWQMQWLCH